MISRGSEWTKWDLHLHSKYSMESRTNMEVEEIFKKAVEKEVKMISITDHSNVDALDEIWDIFENGKCESGYYRDLIDFIPGIELKTDKGEHGVHIISIFPKETYIQNCPIPQKVTRSFLYDNFCAKLDLTKSKIEGNGGGNYAKGLLTSPVYFDKAVELTHELGGLVIIHGGDKHGSVEKEIPNPKGYTPEELYKALNVTKTDIVSNKINIIELPNFNKREAKNAKFYKACFNKPCIIGSDAHEKGEYENLGNKCTWIKANTTFNGLKQALIDYENRIDLKAMPNQLDRVNKNPTKFIDRVNVTWKEGYDGKKGEWFNGISIPLNTGLVSIIGNKGNGKSAIAEIISLVSDSEKWEKFSFLNSNKFLKNKLASNFEGEVIWKSSDSSEKKNLTYKPCESTIEKVQCVPQQYFEEICTDTELEKFTKEINGVIFSRLSEEEREGENTLENLILKYTNSIENTIKYCKIDLDKVNQKIVALENKLKKSYREQQMKILKECKLKMNAHEKIRPKQIQKPKLSEEKQKKYDEIISGIENKKVLLEEIKKEKLNINIKIKNLNIIKSTLRNINERFFSEKTKLGEELKEFELDIDKIMQISFRFQEIDKKIIEYENKENSLKKQLDDNALSLEYLKNEKNTILFEENENIKIYDEFLKVNEEWHNKKKIYFEEGEKVLREIQYINNEIKDDLENLTHERQEITNEIFNEKEKIVQVYNRFKKPIDNFLDANKNIQNEYSISISSGLIIKDDFEDTLFNYINKQKRNAFRDDQYVLAKTISKFEELEDSKEYLDIPNLIINKMHDYDTSISEQVKGERAIDLYNYVYGLDYITNRYELISDNKTLDKLSPGERGALLLIFYLLLDMSDIPLVIDQPEDNLDNQSVAKVLVPFIQEAKKRRQIVMVTHNPNLAVVADSDQIIHMKIDKENNNKVIVESAAIEDIKMNECVVTILEGTMDSFKKREEKYIKINN